MLSTLFRRLLSTVLSIILFCFCFPSGVLATDDPEISESVITEGTLPHVSPPSEFPPEEFFSEESLPEESIPEESFPEESFPEEPIPEEPIPEEPIPEEPIPEESIPEEPIPEESIPEQSLPQESLPVEPLAEMPDLPAASATESEPPGPGLYFGQLHAHSNLSDGSSRVSDLFLQAREQGLDFFAVTDHSDSFDSHLSGCIGADGAAVSRDWAAGKNAAAASTSNTFVGIYGYEMSWPHNMQIGHISAFSTPGFQSWMQEGYNTYNGALERYYNVLSSVPEAVGQFNHPGKQFGTFNAFTYDAAADRVISLLEVGSGSTDAYRYYTKALDQGWHLAPSNNQVSCDGNWSNVRTVVYAGALTEEGIYEAIRDHRVYATEDTDLEILYSMDGYPMGSQLDLRHVGNHANIEVTLTDPTDSAIGLVEVVTAGGKTADKQSLSSSSGTLTFSLDPTLHYYYLRITQPDGDTAVTAPIWIDGEESLGIRDFSCETRVPVQEEPVSLCLTLFNEESADFEIDQLEIWADGVHVASLSAPSCIPAHSELDIHPVLSFRNVGVTQITVQLTGTLDGSTRAYDASFPLSFRLSPQVTGILADGSHQNAGLDHLNILEDLAMDRHIRLTTAVREPGLEQLSGSRFLLVTAPAEPFSQTFLDSVREYAACGGSILLCGQAAAQDLSAHSATELNRLLSAIGASLRIRTDQAQDLILNAGTPEKIYSDNLNPASPWCAQVTEDQVYRHHSGCTIDPGNGTWLVRGHSTTSSTVADDTDYVTLLACEELSGGGTVFAAGSLFLSDEDLAEPKNIWDAPYANRTIGLSMLGIGGETLPLRSIREVRASESGTLVRIRGYVTAGTSNPHNTFPDTLYLQDGTGGIAVIPFQEAGIQVGTPMELTGCVETRNGNRVLKLISQEVLSTSMYRYLPATGDWKTLLNPDQNGGLLVQAEGTCQEVYCCEDGTLSGCLLEDKQGNTATVLIEAFIKNGSDGENNLHLSIRKGRTVRATGLLHIDDLGSTVIRVRNCEEVVYVPPRRFPYLNPRTGDPGPAIPCFLMGSSLAALCLMKPRKKR